MTDLNKESEVNLRFEQDNGAVWVFAGDSQFGTEISHLMMMHADEYSEDELRVICHHAACEIDKLRAELEKAKAQAVPDTHIVVPRTREVVVAIEKMVEQQVEASGITSDVFRLDGWRILDAIQEASESGVEQ
ncbi:hypothetical protein [Acinetobacter baumannii]|uniref:hypothetical protein n=1 Tax=Acinetobacter baumannii TaxID=470 RepID=UPI00111FF2ED|nr:hypothetical protein [Acinetobacter baumannii]MBD0229916.1 hypothetical protein [Acinetobacter baumannii]MBL4063230.1 hypothetical protein [Acinetobacter baumannii]MBP4148698.1 hypothetical protein [Acinetobacter baumannii]MBP4156264.1 hypothetical protein [Acinetobacter baumannii]MBP4167439.1 hypothetical protein [Acinetobacter baumannii]